MIEGSSEEASQPRIVGPLVVFEDDVVPHCEQFRYFHRTRDLRCACGAVAYQHATMPTHLRCRNCGNEATSRADLQDTKGVLKFYPKFD
jgi:hypothetical protein